MRLIDADALQDFIDRNSDNFTKDWSSGAVMFAVDAQPTVDAVEVVRCKDCRWYSKGICREPHWQNTEWDIEVEEDDFCSYRDRNG